MKGPERPLTPAQMRRLERFADEFPEATVVGWYKGGPVIEHDTGRRVRVAPAGRVIVYARTARAVA